MVNDFAVNTFFPFLHYESNNLQNRQLNKHVCNWRGYIKQDLALTNGAVDKISNFIQ